MEEEPAGGRGGIDRLVEDDQIHAEGLDLPHHRNQTTDAPGQPVELHAGHDVERPGADRRVEGVQGRPFLLRSEDAVIDELGDGPAAGRGEGPESEELVLGGLAGPADAAGSPCVYDLLQQLLNGHLQGLR